MKLKLSIHNGLGDVVKLFPFINELLLNDYDITLQTCWPNHPLVKYFFNDKIKYENWDNHWYHHYDERFSKVINLNFLYEFNNICTWYNFDNERPMGIYPVIAYLFRYNGIDRHHFFPKELSPSYTFKKVRDFTDGVYIFTKSTAGNRTLPDELVNKLIKHYEDNDQVRINHEFTDTAIMAHIINNAKFVITVDSGPLHIAEACQTPYHALLTVNGYQKFMQYYKFGEYTYSSIDCSPCNWHHNSCLKFGLTNYECQNGFSFEFLKDLIDSKL